MNQFWDAGTLPIEGLTTITTDKITVSGGTATAAQYAPTLTDNTSTSNGKIYCDGDIYANSYKYNANTPLDKDTQFINESRNHIIHSMNHDDIKNMEAAGITENEVNVRLLKKKIVEKDDEFPDVWLNKDKDCIEGYRKETDRRLTIIENWSKVKPEIMNMVFGHNLYFYSASNHAHSCGAITNVGGT